MHLSVARERIPLSAPFTITGYTFTDMTVVVARVQDRGATGQGEAAGVYYLGDDAERMSAAIEGVRRDVEAGIDREALRRLLPPGGARNALDCALWDLEAKRLAPAGLAHRRPRAPARPAHDVHHSARTTRARWPQRPSNTPRRSRSS